MEEGVKRGWSGRYARRAGRAATAVTRETFVYPLVNIAASPFLEARSITGQPSNLDPRGATRQASITFFAGRGQNR
jgi:hypothetical protein